MFLKLKAEASGWPSSANNAEQRQVYLDAYRQREGIVLDPAVLDRGSNPALRQIAVCFFSIFFFFQFFFRIFSNFFFHFFF